MKPLDTDGETVVLSTKIPAALRARVDRLQKAEHLSTRSEAVRVVLERGLAATNGAPA